MNVVDDGGQVGYPVRQFTEKKEKKNVDIVQPP